MTAAPHHDNTLTSTSPQGAEQSEIHAATSGHNGLAQPGRSIAIGAVLSAMAMVVIDGGLSNIALPSLAASLRIAPSDAVLVITAYQASVVMLLLPSAALGERFGYRPVFAAGVGIFTAASLASASAPSLPWLIGARFVQGMGGAAILALGVALLRFSVSDARLGSAIGWNALVVALSAAAGPAIGALIISVAHWQWLYVANVPLGVAVLVAARALPVVETHKTGLDAVSIALNCAAFGFVILAANAAAKVPLLAVGLFLLASFSCVVLVTREKPKTRPLIPVDLLRTPSFAVSIIASVCCFTGQTAGLIALPFYLQHDLGLTPAMAGLYMAVWPLAVAVTAPFSGQATRSIPTRWLCAVGGALLTAGLAAISLWPLTGAPLVFGPLAVACGAGFGLFQVANNRNMFLSAPPTRSAAAGGMQGTARLIGQTAGALLVAQLFVLLRVAATPRVAMGIGAVFTLVAALVSLLRLRPP